MLDLEWPYERHAALFAGTQQYGNEHGWHSFVDEFVYETLPKRPSKMVPYDGIIARATKPLALLAARLWACSSGMKTWAAWWHRCA